MKMKLLAAAVATLGSVSAFAAPLDPATAVVAPANYIYISGASAQSQALNAVAKNLFDVPADVVVLTAANAGSCAGLDNANAANHVGFLGVRGGQNTLLVYRNSGGSGSGVMQMLAQNPANASLPANANKVLALPGVATAPGATTGTSSNCAAKLPSMSLGDVRVSEHTSTVTGVAGTGVGVNAFNTANTILSAGVTGLQGFGIAVSAAAHTALAAANAAEGIPLINGTQASIKKADYASLISASGSIKDASLFPGCSTIEIARRTDTSGTQAASNIYFLNAKTPGEQAPLTAADLPIADIAANGIAVTEGSSTGQVKTRLNQASCVVGVVSLENIPAGTETWKFVAIDGVSPNISFDLNGSVQNVDLKQRQQHAKGAYDFAFESSLFCKSLDALCTGLRTQIFSATASDLVGFAYLDSPGSWAAWNSSLPAQPPFVNQNKQSRVSRQGNNLNPLMP